ncbi:NUDIX hydrolase [Thalassobacillus hwangdonensis]|uniref:NUDIX hydrolase n=1 Tax=Thalassobacillus hwangdonensis TaxID=546108 RepID=A0ABW3L7Z9_9BACI
MGYIKELRKLVGTRPLLMTGACVIVVNGKEQILLQQRADNFCWGLPGGSLELGESLQEVAKRELYEETGLVANKFELFNVYSGRRFYYKYPHGDEVYNVVTAYVCCDFSGRLKKEDKEVEALDFFDISQLPSPINPPDLPIINEFIAKKNEPGIN